ncbi:MAG: hypothetical protein E7524_01675 [Ruminococcaceae bacterium]|nr:hypothetical protein [Oscillospiraceae bacterium]
MKNVNSHIFEYENLKATTPLLHFNENNDYNEWKQNVRNKLEELLGLPLEKCDADFELEAQTKCDGYINYRFTVQTEKGYYVPCHLLVPDTGKDKYPMTICLSGHGTGMHIALGVAKTEGDQKDLDSWPHRAMGLRAIKDGRAALVIEARNFGESSLEGYGISCTEAGKIAILMGRTIIGERVWDAMRILDVIPEQFPQIDMENIVCTGNSGGGTATYYLACFEERIKYVAPSCAICTYEDSIAAMPHCLCNHVPYIRKYFEMSDLACLIAPRTLVIAAGEKDRIFPIDGTKRNFEEIKRIYKAAGAEDNCALVVGSGGHLNYADHIWEKLSEMGLKS